MEEVQFDEEGIKFRYLSNWREQNKEMVAPNCIKALVKVVEGNPSTITVYKNDAGEYTFEKEGNKVKYIRATDIYDPFMVGAEAGFLISKVNG